MRYSSKNLNEPGIILPLRFEIKVIVEFRPGGILVDHVPVFYTKDPEAAVNDLVHERGWDRRPDYKHSDVWVDGAF
jgi:hypothetical protein